MKCHGFQIDTNAGFGLEAIGKNSLDEKKCMYIKMYIFNSNFLDIFGRLETSHLIIFPKCGQTATESE